MKVFNQRCRAIAKELRTLAQNGCAISNTHVIVAVNKMWGGWRVPDEAYEEVVSLLFRKGVK